MLEAYNYTSRGSRERNEDSAGFMIQKNRGVFVLGDGLGGHADGEKASQGAVRSVLDYFSHYPIADGAAEQAFMKAQKDLERIQEIENSPHMRTTLSFLGIEKGIVYRSYVGDSRIYRFSKAGDIERTVDHSIPQMLALSGQIQETDIRKHPDRNKLLKAMGAVDFSGIPETLRTCRCKKGDAFLLCSDGFWELITEEEMVTCLKASSTPKEWVELMANIVNANGAGTDMDNNTALVVMMK